MSDELIDELRAACNGHPHAKIGWPHRLLHDAADRIEEMSMLLGEAYQVVGQFADYLPDEKALDNLAQQKFVHDDVLPFKPVGLPEEKK